MADVLFDSEFLAQLEQLRLQFRARAAGQGGGGRRSRQQGVSAEFSDFREYEAGDDLRRIDWNAYARFDRLVMKLFLEERQMQVMLLIDQSESMQMSGKAVMAKRLALTMGYLALASYDQVSIVPLGGEGGEAFGPVTGKSAFIRMANYLEALPPQGESRLCQSVTGLQMPGGPGICYLFTDAFSQDGLEDALAYLRYRKKETTLVHILAPEELEPSYEGSLRLIDSETEEQREMEMSAALAKSYGEALQSFCAGLRENCHRYGFRYELVPSAMDLRQAVLEQLIERV